MIGPELLGVVFRNKENAIPRRAAVNLIQMRIQIFAPKIRFLVFVVEDADAFNCKTFRDGLDNPPILSSEGETRIIANLHTRAAI
jgi:hypothetical protein